MSDTFTLTFKNFRSLEDVALEVAPLTVVYGPNGSGKSSLIYGLLTLRNFLTNPNQNMPSLFAYPSISLGGYQEVVHRHSNENSIFLAFGLSNPAEMSSSFALSLHESGGTVSFGFDMGSLSSPGSDNRILNWPEFLEMEIAVPYQGNRQVDASISIYNTTFNPPSGTSRNLALGPADGKLLFDGISLSARFGPDVLDFPDFLQTLVLRANLPKEIAKQTGFVPLRRGFFKPIHNLVSNSEFLSSEDEVASRLASPADRFAQYEVSKFAERIAGRRIQPQAQIGTSSFTIDSIPVGKGTPASIVNEGFGINQLVYLLTICLYPGYKIVAIEEPEIHLHPSMVRELAIALAEIAVEKERRLIISTHSETFVVALLSQIAAGKIKTDDVSFVLAENPDGNTVLAQQKANRNGQIEGGLRAFMASEAKDLVDFLGLSEE